MLMMETVSLGVHLQGNQETTACWGRAVEQKKFPAEVVPAPSLM